MADYFTQFSFEIRSVQLAAPLVQVLQQLRAVDKHLALEPDDWNFEHPWQRALAEELAVDGHEDLPFACEHDHLHHTLWIHDDGRSCVEGAYALLLALAEGGALKRPAVGQHNVVAFEWALTCSKPRLDGFGGGCLYVALPHKGPAQHQAMDTSMALRHLLEEFPS